MTEGRPGKEAKKEGRFCPRLRANFNCFTELMFVKAMVMQMHA